MSGFAGERALGKGAAQAGGRILAAGFAVLARPTSARGRVALRLAAAVPAICAQGWVCVGKPPSGAVIEGLVATKHALVEPAKLPQRHAGPHGMTRHSAAPGVARSVPKIPMTEQQWGCHDPGGRARLTGTIHTRRRCAAGDAAPALWLPAGPAYSRIGGHASCASGGLS